MVHDVGLESLRAVLLGLDTSLSRESWQRIAGLWTSHSCTKGRHLVRPGEISGTVLFVLSGVLRAYWLEECGAEHNLRFFQECMFASSFSAALRQEPSEFGIEALTPVIGLVAPTKELLALTETDADIGRLYRRYLEREWVIKTARREIRIATVGARERYEAFLAEFPGLEERIPLYHIASYLGITNVHLSRIRARRVVAQ